MPSPEALSTPAFKARPVSPSKALPNALHKAFVALALTAASIKTASLRVLRAVSSS